MRKKKKKKGINSRAYHVMMSETRFSKRRGIREKEHRDAPESRKRRKDRTIRLASRESERRLAIATKRSADEAKNKNHIFLLILATYCNFFIFYL
jgi:hypothetical protein